MNADLSWTEISLRLVVAAFAGGLIGFDRGEHGRPAGFRTTILVCLAAAVSMIQVNLMLTMSGRRPDSFVMLDLMRLPLGILSGIGFIGAGAILRQGGAIFGVTTAATLWFVTVMGLCFGAGQITLGLAMLCLALLTLFALRRVEDVMRQDRRATLLIALTSDGPSEKQIREELQKASFKIVSLGITYKASHNRLIRCSVQWRDHRTATEIPEVVAQLASRPGIRQLQWKP